MTIFSDLSLAQTDAGRAVEVWRQTLLEDIVGIETPGAWYDPSWLATFHGGTVHLLNEPPEDYTWMSSRECAVFPVTLDDTELKMGASEKPLVIQTAFWVKDVPRTRAVGEASYVDLAWYMDAAAVSQECLVWKADWAASPPAGITAGGPGFAVRHERIFPVDVARWFDRSGACRGILASFLVSWTPQRIQLEC